MDLWHDIAELVNVPHHAPVVRVHDQFLPSVWACGPERRQISHPVTLRQFETDDFGSRVCPFQSSLQFVQREQWPARRHRDQFAVHPMVYRVFKDQHGSRRSQQEQEDAGHQAYR